MQVKIDMPNASDVNYGMEKNLEKGIFQIFADLIKMDDNIVWDPVGAFFCLSGGYRIQRYNVGGIVYDADDQEFFLTRAHVDKLFALARAKSDGNKRGLLGLFRKRSK